MIFLACNEIETRKRKFFIRHIHLKREVYKEFCQLFPDLLTDDEAFFLIF